MRTRSLQGTALTLAAVCMGVVLAALVPGAMAEPASSKVRTVQAGMLDAGYSTACAIRDTDGSVACWGSDANGARGDGGVVATPTAAAAPPSTVAFPSARPATSISVGDAFGCAVLEDQTAHCWGFNAVGTLGDGGTDDASAPVPVGLPSGVKVAAVTTGVNSACAVLVDGGAYCWGRDADGELGNGLTDSSGGTPVPVTLPVGLRATAISSGGLDFACAAGDDGRAYCWGRNTLGQIGNGAPLPGPDVVDPAQVVGLSAVTAISTGETHACAIVQIGDAYCWGDGGLGQLGQGADAGSSVPVKVNLPVGRTAVAIATGNRFSCAVLDNGGASCWGRDAVGELGDAGTNTNSNEPTQVKLPVGRTAVSISSHDAYTCAGLDDGSVLCWGADDQDRLGDGTGGPSNVQPDPSVVTPVLAAGTITTRLADLSLEITGAPATIALGGTAQVTVKVKNAGPDAAPGVTVGVKATGVTAVPTTLSMGTIASGAEATQVVTLTAAVAGAAMLTAEVTASGAKDPDSTPNNGIATEDDQAQVNITVAAPVATPLPPAVAKLAISKFSLSTKAFRSKGLKGTRKLGTQIRFTLNKAATVTVTIQRKVGTKFKAAGTLRFSAKAGAIKRTFTGQIGKKPLAAGNYRMRIRAVSGAEVATAGPISFKVSTR
jgi:alpha-tubulin suppressor-like RCC1 family protein